MKKLTSLTICLFSILFLHAQSESATGKKQKVYNVSIKTLNNKKIVGKLYSVTDSQLVLVRSGNNHRYIPAENIRSFTMQRKNSALKGALIGFGIGAATGIITGFASGDDPIVEYPDPYTDPFFIGTLGAAMQNAFAMTKEEKAVAGGLGLGATGAIIGAVVGAVAKKKFIIGGKKEKFRDLQSEMMMKLVQK